jgi:hypothetical protein
MKLADARKLAIRDQVSVRFGLPPGLECVVDRHGIARVPGLSSAPTFNLEDEFDRAGEFTIDSGGSTRTLTRQAFEQLTQAVPAAADAGDHDE